MGVGRWELGGVGFKGSNSETETRLSTTCHFQLFTFNFPLGTRYSALGTQYFSYLSHSLSPALNFRILKFSDRRLITILLIVFVQMLGASMALPILPLYAQRVFAMDERVIPLLISVFFAAQFVAGPTIGRLSDQYGRVPVLVVSQIGTAIAFAMLGGAQSVAVLFTARILDGITGGNIIAAQAYITDITPRDQRTQALGYIFAAFGLGFIFGPALGGILSGFFGPRAPFWVAAVAAVVVVLLTWFTLDETVSAEQRALNRQRGQDGTELTVRRILANTPLVSVLVTVLLTQLSFGLVQSTFALWGEAVIFRTYDQRTTDLGIGALLSVVGLGQFFTQSVLLRRLLDRFDEPLLVIFGHMGRLVGLLTFALITTPWLGPLGALAFAVGAGITMPPLQALATNQVDESVRGGVLGYFQAVTNVAIITSTGVAGLLFAIHPTFQYWVGIALVAAAVIPTLFLRRQTTPNP